MTVAILKTGAPPEPLGDRFGSYPQMFTRLLAGPGAELIPSFDVREGQWPSAVQDFGAYVITGSSAGVYDDLPWIAPLKAFLVAAKGKAALVGICFGHQVMAEAFGGRVEKSDKGWAIGLHRYDIASPEPWMDAVPSIAIPASHQDQVVARPPAADVIARSAFTPFAALAYRDQPAISFQGHPEFHPAYAAALIESRRGNRFDAAAADAGVASLQAPNDRERVAGWIRRFLAGAAQ